MLEGLLAERAKYQLTDMQVIGSLFQEMDAGKEFVVTDNNYVWFYALGKFFRPKVIAEMGTRFGYSLKAFVDGAGHRPADYVIRSFDLECDGIQSLDVFEAYFRDVLGIADVAVTRADTKSLPSLGIDGRADLAMVDGDHSEAGCYHECELGFEALRPGGVLVIDDAHDPGPTAGATRFAADRRLTRVYLPSFRGIYLVQK